MPAQRLAWSASPTLRLPGFEGLNRDATDTLPPLIPNALRIAAPGSYALSDDDMRPGSRALPLPLPPSPSLPAAPPLAPRRLLSAPPAVEPFGPSFDPIKMGWVLPSLVLRRAASALDLERDDGRMLALE